MNNAVFERLSERLDMKKIYGNEYLLSVMASMIENKRAAQSVIFCGEKGSGRKLMAKYYTQSLLCDNPVGGRPCGICTSCLNVEKGYHPDVKYVEKSGKLGGYSVETARAVISDSFVKPNNSSGRKIYIFTDCLNIDLRTQNMLLKIIEEPPEYAYFIFTCASRTDFLPTIISRCVCLNVSVCTENEASASLSESGFGDEEIRSAVQCFHGNIGRCTDFITDENLRKQVDLTKSLTDSIIRKDEYLLNVQLFSLGSSRNDVKCVLSMLDLLIRDAAVLGKDSNAAAIGCYYEGAECLSHSITSHQAARIHSHIERANRAIDSNVSIPLAMAALSAEIITVCS